MSEDDQTEDLHTGAAGSEPPRPPPSASIVIYAGGDVRAHALAAGASLTVGRDVPADVVVAEPTLSRQHARFDHEEDGTVWVVDLGSRNGTEVDGERIAQRTALAAGSEVRMGSVRAILHVSMTPASLRAPPPTGSEEDDGEHDMLVLGPAMAAVRAAVERLAPSRLPVLIVGETGTGKELVARALHRMSARRGGFDAINCGAIPEALLEPMLFGHEKGAFTGAQSAAPGLFERADGGTIFLDEVGELRDAAQSALLRVLATQRIRRVGAIEEIAVDVRVLAATHRDLEQMCAEGRFRQDLLYRLNASVITVPPLRERPLEIEPLATHFVRAAAREIGRAAPPLTREALAALRAYAWPGNVRELRNAAERAVVMSGGDEIGVSDLPERIVSPETADRATDALDLTVPFKERMRRYEADLMRGALVRASGNKSEAARLLRMPLRTFMAKARLYKIE